MSEKFVFSGEYTRKFLGALYPTHTGLFRLMEQFWISVRSSSASLNGSFTPEKWNVGEELLNSKFVTNFCVPFFF